MIEYFSSRSSLVSILGISDYHDFIRQVLFELSLPSYAQVSGRLSYHIFTVLSVVRMSEHYGTVMRVMLGDQEWFVLSGLEEIKQFSMKEVSTFHLPSKTFNEMYSFDKPLGIISLIENIERRIFKKTMKTWLISLRDSRLSCGLPSRLASLHDHFLLRKLFILFFNFNILNYLF